MEIFERHGRVSRSDAVLRAILDAVNRTEEITSIANDIQLFVQEYGLIAVHLRGLHRETGLVVIVKVGTSEREISGAGNSIDFAPTWRRESMPQDPAWAILTSIGWHRKPYRMGPWVIPGTAGNSN